MIARISIDGERIRKRFDTQMQADEWLAAMIEKHSDPSLPDEEWRPIPNFSRYEASNFGRLRSLNYKCSGLTKVLAPAMSPEGYLKTMLLDDNGKYKSTTVHRLVISAWKGENKTLEIDHIDGNKLNNNPSNLEWVTRAENVQRGFSNGLHKPKVGDLNGMAKLTWEQVEYARNLKRTKGRFWGRNELAEKWGISAKHLQKIVNNADKSWYTK